MPVLFHLLLVAVSLAPSAGEPTASDTYNARRCPESLSCGDGIDIHYPFYLSNGSEVINGDSYSYCGYPGMGIACVRGHPILRLNNDSYTVLNIDYGNNTVSLADTDALDGGSCPRVRHNVTIPPPLGSLSLMKFPESATDYLSFFFNCAFTSTIPKPLDVEPISCSGFDGGTGLSYVFPQPDVPAGGWPRACEEAYVVPVLRDSLWAVPNYTLFGDGEYGAVLKRGFQLTWDPRAGPCWECERSKGQCSYNQSGGFVGCLCSDGRVRNPDCVLDKCHINMEKTAPVFEELAASIQGGNAMQGGSILQISGGKAQGAASVSVWGLGDSGEWVKDAAHNEDSILVAKARSSFINSLLDGKM